MTPIHIELATAREKASWKPEVKAGMSGFGTLAKKLVGEPPTDVSEPRSNPAGAVGGAAAWGGPAPMIEGRSRSQLRVLRKIVKEMVRPTLVPIWRMSVKSLVAVPSRSKETSFWTMSVRIAIVGPTPTPATTIQNHRNRVGVSGRRFMKKASPIASIAIAPVISHL